MLSWKTWVYPLEIPVLPMSLTLNIAFVAGVKRGRGNLSARERVGPAKEREGRAWSRTLPFRTPATRATLNNTYKYLHEAAWPSNRRVSRLAMQGSPGLKSRS